jgi:quercetin dioxygenase-like cupin family protein
MLVTGEQSGGAYFILEALVGPGGGPPPHLHQREEECFFLLDGKITVFAAGRTIDAGPGHFVHFPRNTVHAFRNDGSTIAKMLAIFSPAGMEGWFAEALDQAPARTIVPQPPTQAMIARMLAAGPRFGVEWKIPAE